MKKILSIFLGLLFWFNFTVADSKTYDVIIIGAGAAGLSAAHQLIQDHHSNILVLEARNRIGGRVWTVNDWGSALDLGASWIHGIKNNPLTNLARQTKTTMRPTRYTDSQPSAVFNSMVIYDSNGQKLSPQQVNALHKQADAFVNYIDTQGKSKELFFTAFEKFSQLHQLTSLDRVKLYWAVRLMYAHEYAQDLEKLTLQNELDIQPIVTGKNVILQEGYINLINYLAKNVPILLNQVVTQIFYDKNGVTVNTNDHHSYHSKYIIITLPLGVLKAKTIQFVPALPAWKQLAINHLAMGYYDKIYLFFDHVFWEKNYEALEYIEPWERRKSSIDILNLYPFVQQPILEVFTAGNDALQREHLSDANAVALVMRVLKRMYGDKLSRLSSYRITHWGRDPYSLGSYSVLPIGSTPSDITQLAQSIENRLFFAGEATTSTDPSTVHGAYITGKNAAEKIAALLSAR